MSTPDERSHVGVLAIAIVMGENARGADDAAAIMKNRADALGVGVDEVAATIVKLGDSELDRHRQKLNDWLHRRE